MGLSEAIMKMEKLNKLKNLFKTFYVVGLFIFIFSNYAGYPLFAIIAIAASFVVAGRDYRIGKELKQIYKETFVAGTLSEMFDDVEYLWEQGFKREDMKHFALVTPGDSLHSEDLLRGSYKGIHFEQADVRITHTSGGKHRHTYVHFDGRMFAFDFPLDIASVQIFSSNFGYPAPSPKKLAEQKMNVYTSWGNTGIKKEERIELENVEFNRQFDVRASREHDAFYVLTPHMMEKIQNVHRKYGNVALHFDGQKVYMGFNTSNDAFDMNPNTKKVYYPEEKEKVRKEAEVIIEIIDALDLMRQQEA